MNYVFSRVVEDISLKTFSKLLELEKDLKTGTEQSEKNLKALGSIENIFREPDKVISKIQEDGIKKRQRETNSIYPRELARQQHKSPTKMRELLTFLSQKERESAVAWDGNIDNFISTIIDGINLGDLGTKVIIALVQLLNEQNNIMEPEQVYNNSEAIVEGYEISKEHFGIVPSVGKIQSEDMVANNCPQCFRPAVTFDFVDFCRIVYGRGDKDPVATRERNNVLDALDKLHTTRVWFEYADGEWRDAKLIVDYRSIINTKTRKRRIGCLLDPVFVHGIYKDFVTLPPDILQRLNAKTRSNMAIRLFWFLVTQESYKKPTYPVERKSKESLMETIAVLPSYKENRGRRNKDFASAIEAMKELRLITAYREEVEKDEIISVFSFDPAFREKVN